MRNLLAAVISGPGLPPIPNPFDGLEGRIAGNIGKAIASGIGNAAKVVFAELAQFLNSGSGRVDLQHGWFTDSGGRAVTGVVASLAVSLMALCLIVAVAQGAVAGEPGQAFRSALVEVPRAALSTLLLVFVAQLLLDATDQASGAVLSHVGADLTRFGQTYGAAATAATAGLAAVVFALLFFVGAVLLWIELLVRSALIYFLVAAAPLVFAARVWPEAKGLQRRFTELGLALILSKLVIAIALALGVAALAPSANTSAGPGTAIGSGLSGLLSGAVLVMVAAATPFVLLKLIPVAEAAVIAQGISRGPARAAQSGMQLSYYGQMLHRVGGGGPGGSSSGGSGGSSSGVEGGRFGAPEVDTGMAPNGPVPGLAPASSAPATAAPAATSAAPAAGNATAGATGATVASGGPTLPVVAATTAADASKEAVKKAGRTVERSAGSAADGGREL